MSVTDKIDKILNETSPSIMFLRKELSKGLSKNVHGITFQVAKSLYHYFDPKMRGSGVIFKTKSSNSLADELWNRTAKSVEDSEMLDDAGIKKLKSNFYNILKKWGSLYQMSNKGKGWEWI